VKQGGADLAREVRLPLEFEVASSGRSCEVHEAPPGGIQFGKRSRPAEISLYLLPRDILSNFS
jgi:hypothetical protein